MKKLTALIKKLFKNDSANSFFACRGWRGRQPKRPAAVGVLANSNDGEIKFIF
jgi:hypothetical protein